MKLYFLALGTALVVCVGCTGGRGSHHQKFDNGQYVAPPAAMMQRPGPMVDGPGPGVLGLMAHPNAMTMGGTSGGSPYGMQGNSQVKFTGPAGMMIGWQAGDGFADAQLVAPGRYDFMQGSTYQLKFGSIPRRAAMTVYPTLEVRPVHPTTQAYLAHNSIPVEITGDDLDQIDSNNFVTKVIYLPDARHQELAIAGVETLVSTQLSPGADPVSEAERRGTVMAILRMGNKDLQMGSGGSAGTILQASYNGEVGQFAAPTPIAMVGTSGGGGAGGPGPMPGGMIPNAAIMAGFGAPGAPGGQSWGMPITGTPIGLPGPPHLPLGGPASLKSHTVRNLTENRLPDPVDHMLIDVKHDPGYSIPAPVKHIQYTEKNPVFRAGQVSYPASQMPGVVGPNVSGGIAGSGGFHHRR
jgi:hypothetical protein